MRSIRHWTPRYVWDRLAVMRFERENPNAPWLTAQAIGVLSTWLKPDDVGLEWGSGRSTVWFAKRVRSLVSVEHDERWGRRVPDMLRHHGVEGQIDYRLLNNDLDAGAESAYVRIVDELEDDSLDFCLVDGMLRDHCAMACMGKVKPGGILIVDNVNWYLPHDPVSRAPGSRVVEQGAASNIWHEFKTSTAEWRYIWTTNGVWDTAIWVKPGA